MKPVYLDYNASTPLAPEVKDEIVKVLDYFGNPSSSHFYGKIAKEKIEFARIQVSQLLNCLPEEIVFTSGGTESNNYSIRGIAYTNLDKGNHIITSSVEHPAVINVCKYLEKRGFEVTYLPVDKYGMINPDDLKKSIKSTTTLITVMHANNEVGTIQPINDVSKIAREYNVPLHSDAAQSTGKISTDVKMLGVDLLSVAGHKLYAPKGIGVLYVKKGLKLAKLMHGAEHERNRRPGTENIIDIVALGKACELAKENLYLYTSHMKKMRDLLHEKLKSLSLDIILNGHPTERLPNTLNIGFKGVEANHFLAAMPELAASAGAACHSGAVNISSVLSDMNIPVEYAKGSVRFSTGRETSENDIVKTVEMIKTLLTQ